MRLFRKGQSVTVFSKQFPQLNGIKKVSKRVEPNVLYSCPHCGESSMIKGKHPVGTYGYFLDVITPNNCCSPFGASFLRPAPKPSRLSFNQIMNHVAKGNPHF